MLKIYPVETNKDIENARKLFEEYADFVKELMGKYSHSWADYHYHKILNEAQSIPEEYIHPKGCLLLAKYQDEITGCIAISEIETDLCELKRLYVKPQFRRMGIGRKLSEAIIKKAAQLKYKRIFLHTNVELFIDAKDLYLSLGFKETTHIDGSPFKGSVRMELELR